MEVEMRGNIIVSRKMGSLLRAVRSSRFYLERTMDIV